MTLYSYVKTTKSPFKKIAVITSIICIFSGISLLAWVLYPIIAFEIFYAPKLGDLVKPVPGEVIKNSIADLPALFGTETTDYTKASVWFPKAFKLKVTTSITSYSLSIPKLGIYNAVVTVGNDDLSKSLIQFTGPIPGEYGNPVIFGHSTLLWFYNPKDYKTIFSKLPELKKGDEIHLSVDSLNYRYKIYEMKIVSPDDISVLEQRYDAPYITLVTCVPPGTYLKRLIVRGKLVNL